jgi:predicted SAM-dependent methyltransferase
MEPRFQDGTWREIRLDLDETVKPDIIASMLDMPMVPSGSMDAVFSSHNLEHLHAHEVPKALAEFRRVLKPDGFLLVTTPDLTQIAATILKQRPDRPVYDSPSGPITAIDMLFGYGSAIENGNLFMAHRTAFTAETLGTSLLNAGFAEAFVRADKLFGLWAYGFVRKGSPVSLELQVAEVPA